MSRDGRDKFFRQMNLDKHDMRIISAYLEIKEQMMKEKTGNYINGKIHTE